MAKDEEKKEKVSKDDQIAALQAQLAEANSKLASKVGGRKFSPEELEEIEMIWPHKIMKPGDTEEVFGMKGIAGEDGFLIVKVPRYKVKNEMTRKRKLIPLSTWKKQREAELEAEIEFE